ncbi:serine/threonine-protein kinase [Jiella sonneratiae]|uniref:Serine/threonine protein kinase n=1 Tax=Jiella sonneratiae TaxID=2816856 RepID=A0ABS3J3X1_9HYPH|nr:serine/threonine-protein kinase [Jiella sonneratiae]MBO0904362.1 serine/threonine protein kinase [Jiella sonneratiae]
MDERAPPPAAASGRTQIDRRPARLEGGTELNDTYVVEELLAAGGMGEVYRGHNLVTGETVAIKVILPEFADDPTFMRLFRREAEMLARLTHDAIVRSHVMAIDRRLGRPYLAMEFVTGRSLKQILAERRLTPEHVRRLLLRLASGLEIAHRAGIVHRDLSPDNVILPADDVDRAKLIDFGIAKSARPGDKTILGDSFAGKYNFVSPEQLGRFGGVVTGKSDVYSLALVAVAALRGRPLPMDGSDYERLEKRSRVPDVADLPEPLRGLVASMLQPDPADRPADMADVCLALHDMEGRLFGEPPADRGWHPRRLRAVEARGAAPGSGAGAASRLPQQDPEPFSPGQAAPAAGAKRSAAVAKPGKKPAGRRWPAAAFGLSTVFAAAAAALLWLWPDILPFESGPTGNPTAAVVAGGGTASDDAASEGTAGIGAGQAPPGNEEAPARAAVPAPQPLVTQGGDAQRAAPDRAAPDATGADDDRQAMLREPPASPGQGRQRPDAPPTRDRPGDPLRLPDPSLPDRIEPPKDTGEAVDDTARFVDFIQRFDGGDCFYAVPADVSDTTVRIEAYATGPDVAARLMRMFKARFGIEPDIGIRPVAPPQCAAVDFASARRRERQVRPAVELAADVISSGETIEANIADIGSRAVVVLFVDSLGFVQDASSAVKRRGDDARLKLYFRLKRQAPERQLMVVLTAEAPFAALLPELPAPARAVFPRLDERLKREGRSVAVGLRPFRIDE